MTNLLLRRYAPVLVLLMVSPLVAEVCFGAIPVSNLGALLPGLAAYGGGAVLIRELARRRGSGWGRIALLGAADALDAGWSYGRIMQMYFGERLNCKTATPGAVKALGNHPSHSRHHEYLDLSPPYQVTALCPGPRHT
jgi:hypothetical protein